MNRFVWTALAASLWLPPGVFAQEQPVALISIKSADQVLTSVETVGKWIAPESGNSFQAQMVQGMLRQYLGIVRPEEPICAAIWVTPDGTGDALICLPVEDAGSILEMLAPISDGVHDVDGAKMLAVPGAGPIYFKSQENWTFVTNGKARLAALPEDPSSLAGSLKTIYDLGFRLNVQALPEPIREQLLQLATSALPMEGPAADAPLFGEVPAAEIPTEEPASEPFEDASGASPLAPVMDAEQMEQQIAALRSFLEETEMLVLGIAVNEDEQQLMFDFAHRAVPGSSMAQDFAAWQERRPTKFGGFYRPEAGLHGHANMRLSEASVSRFQQQLSAARNATLTDEELPPDSPQARGAKIFFDLIEEFFGHGDVDMVASLSFQGSPNLVLAGKVSDTANVAAKIQEASAEIGDQPGVSTREETVAQIPLAIWTFEIPPGPETEQAIALLGDKLQLATGVADDRAYVVVGPPGAEEALTKAVAASQNEANKSQLPSLFLFDWKNIGSHLPSESWGEGAELWQQLTETDAPTHIRWSMRPIKSGGVVRTEVGAGIFAALSALSGSASSVEGSPGGFGPGEDFGPGDSFGPPNSFQPDDSSPPAETDADIDSEPLFPESK